MQKCFVHTYHLITKNIKRRVPHSWDLIKPIISPALSRTFLNKTRSAQPPGQYGVTAFIRDKVSAVFLTMASAPSVSLPTVKRQIKSLIITNIVLTSRMSQKGLKKAPGVYRAPFENYWVTLTQSNMNESEKYNSEQKKKRQTQKGVY